MTPLDSAAREVIQDVRDKFSDYKKENQLTLNDLACECETSIHVVKGFLEGHSPSSVTLFKIKLALGI